jgi:hypothetical protein
MPAAFEGDENEAKAATHASTPALNAKSLKMRITRFTAVCLSWGTDRHPALMPQLY